MGYNDLEQEKVVTRKDLIQQARQRSSQNKRVISDYEGNYAQKSEVGSQYSYSGKSKVIYQRGLGKRSTTLSRNSFKNNGISAHIDNNTAPADTKS
jgi:hypothetical protein